MSFISKYYSFLVTNLYMIMIFTIPTYLKPFIFFSDMRCCNLLSKRKQIVFVKRKEKRSKHFFFTENFPQNIIYFFTM